MLKQRHELHQAGATTNISLAADGRRGTTAAWSSQQAAAAWAWFEHGGSMCNITSHEGLVAAKRNAKGNFAWPSRFKKELLSGTAIPQHSVTRSDHHDAVAAKGHARRRLHSFHDDVDLAKRTSYIWRLSSSSRNQDEGPDQDEDEEGGITSCQDVDDQASSDLFDKFEVDAVCRQLRGSTSCSPSSAELQAQKAHQDHPQAHIKPRRYFKSGDVHEPLALADNEDHQNIDGVVHRLLRSRIKLTTSTSSRSTPTVRAFCSSISTADSVVDHRHRYHLASTKELRAAVAPINQTSKRQESLHDRSHRQNTGRVSNHRRGEMKSNQILESADEGSPAGQLERGEFESSNRKSQEKMQGTSDLELIGRTPDPSRLHEADLLYSKVLQPLRSLMQLLGHNMHGAPPTDDGVARRTNPHRHFHKHHHIHHHHHHYHHLQHIHQASQDALLLDHLTSENAGAHVQHPPKLLL